MTFSYLSPLFNFIQLENMVIMNNFLVILQIKWKLKKERFLKMNSFDSKADSNIF